MFNLVLAFIFDKKIIQYVLIKNLSNKIGFNISFEINKINYFSQQMEIKNIKIKNKKNILMTMSLKQKVFL